MHALQLIAIFTLAIVIVPFTLGCLFVEVVFEDNAQQSTDEA